MKRIIRAAAAASAVAGAALVFVPTAGAASNGIGGCQLNGTAHFGGSGLDGPPLYGPFSYSFDGKLSNCQSSNGAPASGTVFAGEQGLNPATGSGNCGETVSLVGLWRCGCGYTYKGHLLRVCPVCKGLPRMVRCFSCGITVKLPEP